MKRNVYLLGGILIVLINSGNGFSQKIDVARYVDPFIGTGDHGHVFLGAHVPFGAVQVGRDNYYRGGDWCSGYNYSDSIVTGFSQLHLSGTGVGDLGDVQVMPYTGKIKITPGTIDKPLSGYAAIYSHKDEVVKPGYYSVYLKAYDEKVELTASERVAFHRYTFLSAGEAHVAINLASGIGTDKPVKTYIKKVDDFTYTGYRYSTGWANDHKVYFAIKFSRTVDSLSLYSDTTKVSSEEVEGKRTIAILNFYAHVYEAVMLKIGISPVSEENALANMSVEIPNWDFGEIARKAYNAWNKELSKVEVQTSNEHDLKIFYTSLFHAFTAPVLYNDYNSDYLGTDKPIILTNNYEAELKWFPLVYKDKNLPKFIFDDQQFVKGISWGSNSDSSRVRKIDYIFIFGNILKLDEPKFQGLKNGLMKNYSLVYSSTNHAYLLYALKVNKKS